MAPTDSPDIQPQQPPALSDTTVERRPLTDETQRKRTVDLFLGMLEQGEKFPLDEWKEARQAYAGSPNKETRKRSNRFRRQVDTQQAYLHQQLAKARVVPMDGLANDPKAMAEAECEQAVLRYLSPEISLAAKVGRALKSGQITNLGIVFHSVDRIRGVASVRNVRPENLRWDKDCGGILAQASWLAIIEFISPEMLHIATGYNLDKLKKAAKHTSETQGDNAARTTISNFDTSERVASALARCKFVRFFARNEIALYDDTPKATVASDDDKPHVERYLTLHGLDEPRRYLELVDGIDEPLTDDDEWPKELALDTDEWPVTVLPLNDGEASETVAGATDFRHVQKANDAYDRTLKDIDNRTALALVLKLLLAPGATITNAEIKRLLQTDEVEVLKGLLNDQGQALLEIMKVPEFPAILPEVLEIFQQVGDETSATNEIQMGGDAQPQETATATNVRHEAAQATTGLRLSALEDFEAEIYRKLLAMSHVVSPRLSTVEIVTPKGLKLVEHLAWTRTDDPEALAALGAMGADPTTTATELLSALDANGDPLWNAELVEFGVEAMVGAKLAQHWRENVPLAVSRRNCRVEVEHGTTRLSERMDRFALLREVLTELLLPLYKTTGRMDLWIEAVKRILAKAGLSEFDALVPEPPAPVMPAGAPGAPAADANGQPIPAAPSVGGLQ